MGPTFPNKEEMSKEGFNQVCVIHQEYYEVDDEVINNVKDFLTQVSEAFNVKLKYIGFYKSRNKENNDLFFYVHDSSIPTFSIKRLSLTDFIPRWFEDVILNKRYFYPENVIDNFYTWDRKELNK